MLHAATTFDPLLTYGPLGVFVVAFALGLIVAKPIYDRAISDRDRAETQRDAVTKDVMERVVPLLQRTIETLDRRSGLDGDTVALLTDVRRLMERQR
jgi:hypothetical protein